MSLLGGLYVGKSALQTGSNALNTVAHNISNADTVGYTRQSASLATRHYNPVSGSASTIYTADVGLGVKYAEARQVRDVFLDKTYRKESGRSAFYEVSYETMTHVEDLLGESGDNNFQEAVSDYWKTIQDMANDPSSAVTQGLFVSKAQTLIERATNVYNSISDYQDNLNKEVRSMVDQLNAYGERLRELNDQIIKIEVGGVEHANDLRDERNYILDKMAELVDISYSEDVDTYVSVQIEGTDFLRRDTLFPIDYLQNEYGFYTPFWPQNAANELNAVGERVYKPNTAPLFDMTREISSDKNTDIGKLKATILARGDHHGNSDDLKEENAYNKNIAQSICMNIEAEFDQLINSIVQEVNSILQDAGYTDGTNTPIPVLDENGDSVLDEKGNPVNEYDNALFIRIVPEEGWHVGNIVVNPKYLQQPTLVKMKTIDDSVDYKTAEKLKDAFNEEKYTLNPNTTKTSNFIEYYSDLVTQVSNSGAVYQSIYDNQMVTKQEASNAREQIVGVSTDEELQYMIMYQNAYNAASRYITTINTMLESMLNAFGA